jgi:hypothetical protein
MWCSHSAYDDHAGDDSQMAGGFTKLRLSVVGTDLAANVVGHDRFSDTVYGALSGSSRRDIRI